MRSIEKYEEQYRNNEDLACLFEEKYQVKYRQKIVKKSIEKYKHDSILEIGCAMDSQGNYIEDMKSYTIVEPSHEFIEKAKRDLGGNVHYLEGLFEDKIELLEHQNFDFIIIGSLLHELEAPAQFLRTMKRICNKETTIHVNVPNAKSMHRLLAQECGLVKDIYSLTERNELFQQHKIFDMDSLVDLIQQLGGKVLDSGSYFIKPFTHKQMMRCLMDGIIDEQILEGLEQIVEYMPELGSEIYINFKWGEEDERV